MLRNTVDMLEARTFSDFTPRLPPPIPRSEARDGATGPRLMRPASLALSERVSMDPGYRVGATVPRVRGIGRCQLLQTSSIRSIFNRSRGLHVTNVVNPTPKTPKLANFRPRLATFVTPAAKDVLKPLQIDDVCNNDAARRLDKRLSQEGASALRVIHRQSHTSCTS